VKLYLGTHQPTWLARPLGVPLMVSHRRLTGRRSLPRAVTGWFLDSGGSPVRSDVSHRYRVAGANDWATRWCAWVLRTRFLIYGDSVELFFTDRSHIPARVTIAGLEPDHVARLFERCLVPEGMPILLDDAMRPVEPLSSWFRQLALAGRSPKTMRKYAYVALRLQEFLAQRGLELATATEPDLLEYRLLRTKVQDQPVARATWEVEATAINGLYGWLLEQHLVPARPWRRRGARDTWRNGINRDLRVRHMTLEQYLYFRDVGLAGQRPDATIDPSFRSGSPHRSRAGAELALLTGMRLGEWSTVLLPELGIDLARVHRPGEGVTFWLGACAKNQRPREVHVPRAALDSVVTYLLLERGLVVDTAQPGLAKRRADLFVVTSAQHEQGSLRGVLDGVTVTRRIVDMPPRLRRITVMDTGDRLEPLAVFIGSGGSMPHPSTWDKIRWRAWNRMRTHANHPAAAPLPTLPWLFHDLRHTFALRLLLFLMRKAVADAADLPMTTLTDHIARNPLLEVQRRLGHASPASTYIYLRYLTDPMAEVDEAFREWTDRDASYAEIGQTIFTTAGGIDAPQR
jgi:integrase